MSQSRSNRSKSSRSGSSRKRGRSNSRSPQKRQNRQRSRSYNRQRRRSNSYERRRSPGRGARRNPDLIPKSAKLFVTNIDSSINAQDLRTDLQRQFKRFGQIISINIKTKSGSSNSFAFIQYSKTEDAQAALNEMRGKQFKGKELKVQFGKGQKKQQDRRTDKCYICHRQGHFAMECRFRDRERDYRNSRDFPRRRRYSRSSSSSRGPRRKRSYDRQREFKRREAPRQFRSSPDRRRQRQYRGQRRQRF